MRDDAPLVWERVQVHHFKNLFHCLRHWVILLSLSLTARSMFFSGKPCHVIKAFGKHHFLHRRTITPIERCPPNLVLVVDMLLTGADHHIYRIVQPYIVLLTGIF